ncbi:MAG: MFS transporter [Methylocystis sp.]|nr:MFS transporter [Methylocystis sp.]MCA3582591.1 MFS transporter [Methylocystis sp.]MCA3586886.1 MFS transporter [Methylocystis sp.]MCA3591736.1 MFS transporter [Methylocystis sp.]
MADVAAPPRPGSALRRAIPVLGFTQMAAWGTTYYLPAIFKTQFSNDLGLSEPAVFAGVAVTLIVSALIAWPVGRLMDEQGAGRLMPVGSACLAAGLATLAFAQGPIAYFLAWTFFGFGMALCMSNAAFSALTQMAGQEARRSIVILMLFGGMASTVFWPLTLWLDGQVGWRSTCLIYAGMHILICLPLHGIFLASGTTRSARQDLQQEERPGLIPPERRGLAAVLITIVFSCSGFVSWGLDLHLITILGDFGLGAAAAVWVASLKGPATLAARLADITLAGRVTPMQSAMIAGSLTPLGLVLALVLGSGMASAVIFIVVYSLGTGLITVARATLPLLLIGSKGYATTLGRLTLPTQMIYAVSPMTFGLMMERVGSSGVLLVALFASLVSLWAMLHLMRMTGTTAA